MFAEWSSWGMVVLFTGLILIVLTIFNRPARGRHSEGFATQGEKYVTKEGGDLYDEFYVGVYDDLVHNDSKNRYEVAEIVKMTAMGDESRVLDVGCGTGHHVGLIVETGADAVGVDAAPAMIARAKENYPALRFRTGDVQDAALFDEGTFTHITCLYFTIYYLADRRAFFANAFKWLQRGGFLIVHLVHREQFDPILPPGNPLMLISPQRYAKNRITSTRVVFDDFDYASNFELDRGTDTARFKEKFVDRGSGKVRNQTHTLHMATQKAILAEATEAGFLLEGRIDLLEAQYEYQYLFVLAKPE